MTIIKIIIDNDVVNRYNEYYFKQHPRAKKKQIEKCIHPSINIWSIKPRIQMNALKQSWKNFIIWLVDDLGYTNMKLNNMMLFTTYTIQQKEEPIQITTALNSSMTDLLNQDFGKMTTGNIYIVL